MTYCKNNAAFCFSFWFYFRFPCITLIHPDGGEPTELVLQKERRFRIVVSKTGKRSIPSLLEFALPFSFPIKGQFSEVVL